MLKILTTILLVSSSVLASAQTNTMIVFDGSGSMWGQIDGRTKIEIAKTAVKEIVSRMPSNQQVGLIAYGHRTKGDCNDIETLIPVQSNNPTTLNVAEFSAKIDNIIPKGMTPLSAAVKHAAEDLKYTENKATVILISDGVETCKLDPCQVGEELEKSGIDFTAHVIGFDVTNVEDQKGLKCLAENTGGIFIPASNAKELQEALEKANQPVPTATPTTIPTATNTPEFTPTPLPAAKILSQDSAPKGTEIVINFESSDNSAEGGIALYAKGAKNYVTYTYVRVNQGVYEEVRLRLPIVTGPYTLKWELEGNVLAEKDIEIIDSETSLSVSPQVTSGATFNAEVIAPEGLEGIVNLYSKNNLEKNITYAYVRSDKYNKYEPLKFTAPVETGKYVLIWTSTADQTVAQVEFEVIEAQVSLNHVREQPIGTDLEVSIDAPEGVGGIVNMYTKGNSKSITYAYVRVDAQGKYQPLKFNIPFKEAEYELKWTNSLDSIVATSMFKASKLEATFESPEKVSKGSEIDIKINAPAGLKGMIYLYNPATKKNTAYAYVRLDAFNEYEPIVLKTKDEIGAHKIRWMDQYDLVIFEKDITIE